MSIDPKFVALTADVFRIVLLIYMLRVTLEGSGPDGSKSACNQGAKPE